MNKISINTAKQTTSDLIFLAEYCDKTNIRVILKELSKRELTELQKVGVQWLESKVRRK